MNTNGIFSRKTDCWATPQWLFDQLNDEFRFGLDVCALPENAKCERYFSPKDDGLSKNWGGVRNSLVQPSVWQSHRRLGTQG